MVSVSVPEVHSWSNPFCSNGDLPLVSVVMPIKNEAEYLSESLRQLNVQSYPHEKSEILIVDGGSTDGTLELVQQLMALDPRIRLFGGKNVNCPLAMNIGIKQARGEFIAKVDGHGYVNEDFIRVAIESLLANEALACVGGQIIPIGGSAIAQSNKYARFSRFGIGRGVYTTDASMQEVDSVQCGIYRKTDLVAVGMFDPKLQFGEDEEVNYRLIQAGKKILYHPEMQFFYYIRPTFKSLFKQYFNYGGARVKVIWKHPSFIRLKHCVPSAVVLSWTIGCLLMALGGKVAILGAAVISVYTSFLLGASVILGLRNKFVRIHYLVLSLLCLHVGYGIGMLRGLMTSR